MSKLAIIGEKDAVLAFKSLSIDVFPATEADDAAKALRNCAKEGYAIVYITEQVASLIEETIDEYKTTPFPVVIPIPGSRGSLGIGIAGLHRNVEKAVGVDILINEKER